jgi:hypothetical protein
MSFNAENLPDTLREMARTMVGDGKKPNVHFVTNAKSGEVVALFVGDDSDSEASAIDHANKSYEPLMVEDRLTGVVHDNEASEAYQEECRRAEEGEG